MAVGYFHPMWGESLDRRTHIPGVKYPKRTPKTNAAIVDVVGSPVDFWRGVKCWDYGRDIFAMTPKTGGKSQNDGFHFMCFGAILYCNTTEFPCLRFHNQFQPRATRATVYQLRADVLCPDGMVNAFARIIGLVLPFVAKSLYTKLPARSGGAPQLRNPGWGPSV